MPKRSSRRKPSWEARSQLKATSGGVSGNLTVQAGYIRERGRTYRIRPKIDKIPNSTARLVLKALDPVLEGKIGYNIFAGAEGKAEAAYQRGGDRGTPRSVGASGFAGLRIGGTIEGNLYIGQIYGAQPSPDFL